MGNSTGDTMIIPLLEFVVDAAIMPYSTLRKNLKRLILKRTDITTVNTMTINLNYNTMSYKIILGNKGQVRARLYEGGNDQADILSRTGRRLGFYHQSGDRTYDGSGRYVGPGDQRMSLIEDNND